MIHIGIMWEGCAQSSREGRLTPLRGPPNLSPAGGKSQAGPSLWEEGRSPRHQNPVPKRKEKGLLLLRTCVFPSFGADFDGLNFLPCSRWLDFPRPSVVPPEGTELCCPSLPRPGLAACVVPCAFPPSLGPLNHCLGGGIQTTQTFPNSRAPNPPLCGPLGVGRLPLDSAPCCVGTLS